MRILAECVMEIERLAEKGIVFVCPNCRYSLRRLCPYAAWTNHEEGQNYK